MVSQPHTRVTLTLQGHAAQRDFHSILKHQQPKHKPDNVPQTVEHKKSVKTALKLAKEAKEAKSEEMEANSVSARRRAQVRLRGLESTESAKLCACQGRRSRVLLKKSIKQRAA